MRATRMRATRGAATGLSLAMGLLVACGESPAPTPPPEVPAPAPPPAPPAPPPVVERPGPTCTYHGFCWARPLPTGNDLHGVWMGGGLVVAVGERGTLLVRDGEHAGEPITAGWTLEDAPSRELLRDVFGASRDEVWAVGEAGTIFRRGADGWAPVESGVETALVALFGRAADDVFAVGEAGVILHWDGSAWAREPVATEARFTDVVGDATRTYAVAVDVGAPDRPARSQLFERTDTGWQPREELSGDLPALHLATDGTLLLVGGDARRRPPQGRFTTQRLPIDRPVNALWASGVGAVHAVGYGGRAARLWEGSWSAISPPGEGRDLSAIAGEGEVAWAVGADGALARFDAGAWETNAAEQPVRLEALWGPSPRELYAVGDRAALRFDGATWAPMSPSPADDLRAVASLGGTVLAVGHGGAIHRLEAGSWVAEPRVSDLELDAVGGVDLAHAVIVGKTTWLTREGEGWRQHEGRPSASGVWASGPTEAWIASREGLHRWDGAAFTPVSGTAEHVLFDVWGAAPDDVWAVGAEGHLLHYDGRAWAPRESPTTASLLAVWGSGPRDVWAVGHHGTVLHFDGEVWRWRDSGTDASLHGVFGAAPGEVWVVGEGGVILRRAAPAPG